MDEFIVVSVEINADDPVLGIVTLYTIGPFDIERLRNLAGRVHLNQGTTQRRGVIVEQSAENELSLPITSVVNLARSFTPEQWRHAAHIAADDTVETICTLMARLAARQS